ncbi:MAG TPA: hypothetical protein VKB26_08235 [Candidatus Acidoferrales bacterium]|nr:hypothetical protein [Candidatus Acidoferrales bacterium]
MTLFDKPMEGHFPCPVCGEGLDVRTNKRNKPYVVCNRCGVQLFIRVEAGIRRFHELVERADFQNIWERLAELEGRYKLQCPKCRKSFWVSPDLIATSWFDGRFIGYRCPEEGCDGAAKPQKEKQ